MCVPVLGLLPPTDGVGCSYTAVSRLRSVIRSWKSDVMRETRRPFAIILNGENYTAVQRQLETP